MILIYFIYGLAFFSMGLATFILFRKESGFKLAQNIRLLGGFGIVHGVNEWLDMLKLIGAMNVPALGLVKLVILAGSYLFLIFFGLSTIKEKGKKASVLKLLLAVLCVLWIIAMMSAKDILLMNIWTRYILGIPGAVLTVIALFLQLSEFKKRGMAVIVGNLKLGIFAFSVYGFLSGVFSPAADFFPASVFNYETFIRIIGVPVQLFRAACAVVIAYAIVRVLSVFEWETNTRIKDLLFRTRDSYAKLKGLEKTKDSLTHMIVHDLNNPVMLISGNLQLLILEGEQLNAQQNEYLSFALAATENLKRMINNLLDINKMEENKLRLNYEKFSLRDLIQGIVGNMNVIAHKEHKSVSFDSAQNMPEMFADKELIRRIVTNLAHNAIKHSFPSGMVIIKAFFKEEDGHFYVEVIDSGEGIPEGCLDKVFDKFFQVQDYGTKLGHGLGLAFCKMAVEVHGGKIRVESGIGEGCTFTFIIPLKEDSEYNI